MKEYKELEGKLKEEKEAVDSEFERVFSLLPQDFVKNIFL